MTSILNGKDLISQALYYFKLGKLLRLLVEEDSWLLIILSLLTAVEVEFHPPQPCVALMLSRMSLGSFFEESLSHRVLATQGKPVAISGRCSLPSWEAKGKISSFSITTHGKRFAGVVEL